MPLGGHLSKKKERKKNEFRSKERIAYTGSHTVCEGGSGRVASLLPSVEALGSFNPTRLERNSLFLPPRTSLTSDGGPF